MKFLNIHVLYICTLMALPIASKAEAETHDEDLQEARLLVNQFSSELKSALMAAMKVGGPTEALDVCKLQAGPIAEKNSSSSTWNIARTSLKVRNINNEPDEWESNTLLQFEKRKSDGEDLNEMEYSELIKQGDQIILRYMKPIPTAGLCLTCHGSNLSDEISDKVKTLYPSDKAIGFNVGDIRGAFTLQKIIE